MYHLGLTRQACHGPYPYDYLAINAAGAEAEAVDDAFGGVDAFLETDTNQVPFRRKRAFYRRAYLNCQLVAVAFVGAGNAG